MTTFGLTPSGFEIKPLETILAEIEADELAGISPTLNVEADALVGQLNGVMASKIRELWELAAEVYDSQYRDTASGRSLDFVGLLTGTPRADATPTRMFARLQLTAGTTVPAGSVASIGAGGARFVTKSDTTNSGGTTAWIEDVETECQVVGPTACNAHTLNTIVTAVSGWLAVDNNNDATMAPNEIGTNVEIDSTYRTRAEEELHGEGGSTADAIRAALLKVTDVKAVIVFENFTDATVDTVPPHAFEAVVLDGAATDIAAALWANKPIGIATSGGTSQTTPGQDGVLHTMNFTRPTVKTVYLDLDITIDASKFPADGDDQIKAALSAYGAAHLSIGDVVILAALYASIFSISGVTDAPAIRAGFTPSPVGTSNLTIGAREIANIDTANITVNHV